MNFKFLEVKKFYKFNTKLFSIFRLIILVKPTLVHAITIKPVILAGIASRFFKNTSYVASISGLDMFLSQGESSQKSKNIS